jgi:cytochrome c biogenesis protein CcmG/thiol:disulfide interchange protein DsbE
VELPRLESLWQKYRDQGFQVVAVERGDDREGALKFIEENELSYHLVQDKEEGEPVVNGLLKVYGFPTSLLVDRQGRVIRMHLGFDEGDEVKLEEEILELL